MECFHQGILPKVCPALSEVVLAHSMNHNSSLSQLPQRCWYSLHLRCQLQPGAHFLQHFKIFIEIIIIVTFSLCKFISEWLLCKLYTSNYQPVVPMYTPGGMPTTERGTQNFKFNIWFSIEEYIQTYVQRPPLGPENGVVWKRLLIKFRFRLVVDDSNWSFITSGCYS